LPPSLGFDLDTGAPPGAAWLLERSVRAAAFGWESSGAAAVAIVSGAVLLIAIVAAVAPARRALRIDPVLVLRAE
jgi:hypothetical protein